MAAVSRASFYRPLAGESVEALALMRLIDETFLECPFYAAPSQPPGFSCGRQRVQRLMRKIGLSPVYCAPRTSAPNPGHRIYPYLLRHLTIGRLNQAWCADITYIPMRRGFLYLVAIMDWATRKVLSIGLRDAIRSGLLWRFSNTKEADFCVEALNDALAEHGTPEIFNTDQGSHFTSLAFTGAHADAGIRISMDGRWRWMDNVFSECLWGSLKYECVFLNAFETGGEARDGIGRWISFYNERHPHSALGGKTPGEAYAFKPEPEKLAA